MLCGEASSRRLDWSGGAVPEVPELPFGTFGTSILERSGEKFSHFDVNSLISLTLEIGVQV